MTAKTVRGLSCMLVISGIAVLSTAFGTRAVELGAPADDPVGKCATLYRGMFPNVSERQAREACQKTMKDSGVGAPATPTPSSDTPTAPPRIDPPAVPPKADAPATGLITAMSADRWIEFLKETGYTQVALRDGSVRTGKANKIVDAHFGEVAVALNLSTCNDDGACSDVNIAAYFGKQPSVSPKMVNRFNTNHYARLVMDEDTDLKLVQLVYFAGGVSKRFLTDIASSFSKAIGAAIDFPP